MSFWTTQSIPLRDYWINVIYINKTFIALANSGSTMKSSDGINWSIITNNGLDTTGWKQICYGNNKLVAISQNVLNNKTATSSDGITWVTNISPIHYPWISITYGNNIFVAVAGKTNVNNSIMNSSNGINWTVVTTIQYICYNSVTFGNGLFVAIGSNSIGTNTIMTSTDGTHWSNQTCPTTSRLIEIIYGNGIFVIIANGTIITSVNGINWNIISTPIFVWTCISYVNNIFIIYGKSSSQACITSIDGINWISQTTPVNALNWTSINYGNNIFVIFASSTAGGGGTNTILTAQSPTLTEFSIPNKLINDSPFLITKPTSNSTGSFDYISSNLEVATISNSTITIIKVGTSTISATQKSSSTFAPATINTTLTVNPATLKLTNFSISPKSLGDVPFTLAPPESDSNGSFVYTSSDTSIAIVENDIVTIVGVGSCTITALQAQTSNYLSATTTATLTVNKATVILGPFTVPTNQTIFTLTAPSSNSTGAFVYTSSDTSVVTISGSTVTIVKAGSCTITATQTETNTHLSVTTTATFTIINPPPTLGTFTVPLKTFGDVPFTLTAPSSNSTGAFVYTSSDTSVVTISGSTVTIVKAGTTTLTVIQEETTNYTAASTTTTLSVSQATPILTGFINIVKTFGEVPVQLFTPISLNKAPFTYVSSNTAVVTISGSTATIAGPGTTMITATQTASGNYTSATISALFTVDVATASNPVKISDGTSLTYFLTTPSKFVSITSSIVLDVPLKASTTTTKTISASGSKIVKLTARKR